MKNHLVSDNNCHTVNYPQILKGVTNDVGLPFSVGDTLHHNLQLVLSKTIRIGDTTYHI
jgi:hypothetical protein